MPCNSDYMEPNAKERNRQQVARLLVHVLTTLSIPDKMLGKYRTDARHIYGGSLDLDAGTARLCELMTEIERTGQAGAVLSDISNPLHRELFDWWEEHKRADIERERREREKAEKDAARAIEPVAWKFWGESDDRAYVQRGPSLEEGSAGSYYLERGAGKGREGMVVSLVYSRLGKTGTWAIAISQLGEGIPLPSWPLSWETHSNGYSTMLGILAPSDAEIKRGWDGH